MGKGVNSLLFKRIRGTNRICHTPSKVDNQPVEGEMDVSSGDVRSGAAGLHGRRYERSGSRPGVRPAPGHRAQDAGLLGAAGLPARGPAAATQPFDKLRRSHSPA